MELVKTYAEEIALALDGGVKFDEIMNLMEQPKFDKQGDLAFPCFTLAKSMRKSPDSIAEQLAARISNPLFERVVAEGPYVNCFYHKSFVSGEVLKNILHIQSDYGSSVMGQSKTVTLDFSSPNIAKPFSMGHLRSTVIGNSLALLSEKCGYKAVRINHLGDWGTQFGKLITAYKLWGSEQEVRDAPISELLKLYVKFHEEVGNSPELESEARLWFKNSKTETKKLKNYGHGFGMNHYRSSIKSISCWTLILIPMTERLFTTIKWMKWWSCFEQNNCWFSPMVRRWLI